MVPAARRWAQAILLAALVALVSSPSRAQEKDSDIQKELSNPIASLTLLPIQPNFDFKIGPEREGSRVTTNIQPVLPFKLTDDITLVVRTILPIIAQRNIFPGAGSQVGLGDTLQSFFFVPPTKGGFTWGVGPAVLWRTDTDPLLGTGKWAAGPTLVALQATGPWTIGVLTNHIWSFAGDADRSDVSSTFVQPFIAYAASGGWTYNLNSQSTYDWVAKKWSVPILGSIAKLTKIGDQPVNIQVGAKYWAETPEGGPHGWGGFAQLTFIFK